MIYKMIDILPIGFKGNLYIYTQDELYLVVKIKVPLTEEKKIFTFVFDSMKDEFKNSKDKEVKKARKVGMIGNFVNNIENIFSDEDIENVLTGFTASDELK